MHKKEFFNFSTKINPFYSESMCAVVSPVENLRRVENSDGSLSMISDVTLLMDQQRLSNLLTPEQLRSYLDATADVRSSPYSNQLSDDDLLQTLKSRYIQTPSELRMWAESILQMDLDRSLKAELESDMNENTDNSSQLVDDPSSSAQAV